MENEFIEFLSQKKTNTTFKQGKLNNYAMNIWLKTKKNTIDCFLLLLSSYLKMIKSNI